MGLVRDLRWTFVDVMFHSLDSYRSHRNPSCSAECVPVGGGHPDGCERCARAGVKGAPVLSSTTHRRHQRHWKPVSTPVLDVVRHRETSTRV